MLRGILKIRCKKAKWIVGLKVIYSKDDIAELSLKVLKYKGLDKGLIFFDIIKRWDLELL